jgi:CSLREA domain-containing protein
MTSTSKTLLGQGAVKNALSLVNNFHQVAAFLPMLLITVLFFAVSANAATYTVNTLADNESNTCSLGACTLREAVNGANGTIGNDTINFLAGLTGTIVLTGGDLDINSGLLLTATTTINGPGARVLAVSGNNASRVFTIQGPGTTANISGLTIRDGSALPILIGSTLLGDGGGILNTNGGTLTLTKCHVTNNHSTTLGGGVASHAILLVVTTTNLIDSTIDNNTSVVGGGGVSNAGTDLVSSGIMNITNCTVTLNSALAEGGGIANLGGNLDLNNVTVSHNQSLVAGGGIANLAGTLLGEVSARNVLLSQNKALVGLDLLSSDVLGGVESHGGNFVSNNRDVAPYFAVSLRVSGLLQPNINLDIVGGIFAELDPLLGPLQNNGGPTDTRALNVGSPAINIGQNCITTHTCSEDQAPAAMVSDQRQSGYLRRSGSNVDSGAFETQLGPTAAEVTVSGRVTIGKNGVASRVRVTIADMNGGLRTTTTNGFGYYSFDAVRAGEVYIVSAKSSRTMTFNPVVITVNDDMTGVNLFGF